MSKKKYDEKQIIEKGKSFQCAFISAIVINVIIYILGEFIDVKFSNDALCLINIGVPIAVYMMSMILKNAYDGISNAGESLSISALGGFCVALLILYLPDVLSGKKSLLDKSIITESTGALLISILMLITVVTYWTKKIIEKKKVFDE